MNKEIYLSGLWNLGTTDGREIAFTQPLRAFLSEGALHRYRATIQIENLIALSAAGLGTIPPLTEEDIATMRLMVQVGTFESETVALYDHFEHNGVGPLEHDVKAVETHLRFLFDHHDLGHLKEFIHFPFTSEDANNLAWNLMLREAINGVWFPKILEVCDKLAAFAERYADTPVLGITHGMSASPTTFGKRFAYFLGQLTNSLVQLQTLRLSGKYSGPVGNHNAMTVAAPHFDFEHFAQSFVESLGFTYESAENQRNSHVSIVRILNEMSTINIVAADLCEHVRHSVMMGWLSQVGKPTHVGSSVMPHKINPWFFEVGQGYFEQSTAHISAAGPGLIQSVFERDLTDHPWERSYGEMIGKSLIGLCYISQGLDVLVVNDKDALEQLRATPEILTEAVQIVGRLYGVSNVYMTIKQLSRGKNLTRETLDEIINSIIPEGEVRECLLALTPETYYGKAATIARAIAKRYGAARQSLHFGILHPLSGIEAVLFDFDNTLHLGDKEELAARLKAISVALGSDFSDEEISTFGSHSDYRDMRRLMVAEHNKRQTDNLITEEQFQNENDKVTGTFDHFFYLAKEAEHLLVLLRARGYKTAVVTTRGNQSLTRILETYNIRPYFDVIVNRDDCKEKKPHPQPIATALQKLGVQGCNAMYIGDKQVDDIIAGCALGMKTALISSEHIDTYGALPSYHFSTLKEVIGLFR